MARKSPSDSAPATNTQQKILGLFINNPRARLTPIEIHRRAGFPGDDLQRVVDALRELCRQGRLVRLKKNHHALPDRQNLVTGKIHA
ncbi:MAG: hypothetical protein ACREX3_13235, partial [Gammaproteobacteria bacterium]